MKEHPQPEAEIRNLLQDLWRRHLPVTLERLEILERSVLAASAGHMEEPLKSEALSAAHKLAGNLGMFGHKEAGEVAGEIENIFKEVEPETSPHLSCFVQRLRHLLEPYLSL